MAQQLPYTDQASGCIYLDDKSPCGPDYYGYPIKGGPSAIIPGLPGDYSGLTTFLNEVNNPQISAKNIADPFKCQADQIAPAVTALRYQVSTFCAQLVLWSLLPSNTLVYPNATTRGGGCILPTISGTPLKPDGPLLCKEQCDIGVNGFANIIKDSELCTDSDKANGRIARSEAVCSSFGGRTAENGGCLAAVQSELSTCGFRSTALANSYCPDLAATDACCSAFINAGSNSSNSTDTFAKSSSNTTKLAPIIGGVVGGIALIAIIAVVSIIVVRNRNKNKRRSNNLAPVVPAYASNDKVPININGPLPTPEFQTALHKPNKSLETGRKFPQQEKQQLNQQQQNSVTSMNPWQAHRALNGMASESNIKPDAMSAQKSQTNSASSAATAAAAASKVAHNAPSASVAKALSPVPPSPEQAIDSSIPLSDAIMRIIHPYEATLADELSLVLGRTIVLLKSFDDGWALGLDPNTGAQGAFPLVCVVSDNADSSNSSAGNASSNGGRESQENLSEGASMRFSKRVSSAMLTAEQMNSLATVSATALTSESTGSAIPPAVLKARGVKFDSGVPNTVHVYPRESISASSSFSYTASDAGTDVTAQ